MARILLGVSGGIAAYKAVEFVRLATAAGHGVRVLMTASATRFVGPDSFEGILGAPVLDLRVRARPDARHLPRRRRARARSDRPPRRGRTATSFWSPRLGQHDRQAGRRQADSILTTSFLACEAPRLVAPAMNDRMYADAATQANLATLRGARHRRDRARRGQRSPRRASTASAACRTRAQLLARVEAALAGRRAPLGRAEGPGHRRRHPRADRPGPLHRQPLQRPHGFRPRRTRRPRGAEVTVIAANVTLPSPPASSGSTSRPRPSCRRRLSRFPRSRRPADGRRPGRLPRRRPPPSEDDQGDGRHQLDLEPTDDILAGLSRHADRRPDRGRFAAEHGGDATTGPAASSSARAPT